jgi:hypothetical protein
MEMKSAVDLEVDRLFREAPDRFEKLRRNPVTGSNWVAGEDPIGPQKRAARRALAAREWFAKVGPPDAPPFPLSYCEREDLKRGGLPHILAWYARSLEARKYDVETHPTFDDYARGVLASPYAPPFITQDQQLRKRFPPTPLHGLGSGLYWEPPRTPAKIRRATLGQQKCLRASTPPAPLKSQEDLIKRDAANVPDWYAPWASSFLRLPADFVAHATKYAACKRLPRAWSVSKPRESFSRLHGDHMLRVRAADHGWLIERTHVLELEKQILVHNLLEAPVLCPTYATAARLAQECYPEPGHGYQLTWHRLH